MSHEFSSTNIHALEVVNQAGIRDSSSNINLPTLGPHQYPLDFSFAHHKESDPVTFATGCLPFFIDDCVFPLRSLMRLPIAVWNTSDVLTDLECQELVDMKIEM